MFVNVTLTEQTAAKPDICMFMSITGPSSKQSVNAATRQQSLARKQKLLQQRELARQRAQEFAQGQNSDTSLPPSHRLSQSSSQKTQPQEEAKAEASVNDSKAMDKASGAVDTMKDTQAGDPKPDASDVGGDGSGSDVKELDEKEAAR